MFLPQHRVPVSECIAAVTSSSFVKKTELQGQGQRILRRAPRQALSMPQIKKPLQMHPFSCSNHESILFLLSKETFPKLSFSQDRRRWGKKVRKLVFSRLLFSPYIIYLCSKFHPVAYPKYTTLNLGCTKIFIRVKYIPISNELYDSKV